MHETEEQPAGRLRLHAAPNPSDVCAAEQTDPRPLKAASTLSVRVLATQEHHPHVAVLSVHGEIDLVTAPILRESLAPVLEHHTGPVVVDLSEVAFTDSTGVHVLTEALGRLEPQSRGLAVVCRDGGQVHRLLVLMGLLDALTVHRSRESAVIGGDDLLRPESVKGRHPFDARTPTPSPLSARPITQKLSRAARDPGHSRTFSARSASAGAWAALRGPRTDLAPAIH